MDSSALPMSTCICLIQRLLVIEGVTAMINHIVYKQENKLQITKTLENKSITYSQMVVPIYVTTKI